jgi:carboxyvinyl-carboxyphosphonate phosphorylmutase
MSLSPAGVLRRRLAGPRIMVVPGASDALTARLIEQAGFEAVYATGAGFANAALAVPDLGLPTMTEVVQHAQRLVEAVAVPVIIDADTGYGNALNVMRTVRELERIGAAAIQIEDQVSPKRCGHFEGKEVVSAGEMCTRIAAAVAARRDPDLVLIARTDAVACNGLADAVARANAYVQAGADVIFVEAPRDLAELQALPRTIPAPLLANMVEGGKTPPLSAAELAAIGFALVIFPGGIVRAFGRTASDYYASLAAHGTTEPFRSRMLDFDGLNDLIGTPEMIALGERYETPLPSGKKTGVRR